MMNDLRDDLLSDKEKENIDGLLVRFPKLVVVSDKILQAYFLIRKCYRYGGKLLAVGNGGSAADAQHIVGELMKSFEVKRPVPPELRRSLLTIDERRGRMLADELEMPLTALSLVDNISLATAYINDVGDVNVYAQQLLGVARKNDVLLALSTSGNSENIVQAVVLAKALGVGVVAMTGESGGILKGFADITINVPEDKTYKIQELHLPIYHCLCRMLEDYFFNYI